MSHTVRIRRATTPIQVAEDRTILETALDAGINYPHSCRSGMCGTCKSRLLSGRVDMLPYEEFALTDEEKDSGLVLACRSRPRADCEVAWLEFDDAPNHPLATVQCTVRHHERMTHDVVRIVLDQGAGGPLAFSAGQFAQVTFDSLPRRDYSFASRPDEDTLEFHVRHIPGGQVSAYVEQTLKVGEPVSVHGPFGMAHLREFHTGPILAVAGGSGLAPVKAIVETALARSMAQPIHLYLGMRAERDVYFEERFRELTAAHPNLTLHVVLSEPDGDAPRGERRSGFVHEAVAADITDLEGFKCYTAGPPVMVEALTRHLRGAGMRMDDIHADAFYTEAELAERGLKPAAGGVAT
ncbi:MAG: 2Fe-2S iron-sulfur cluster-binding protein [Alphaproteobacteria bacterium]